MMDKYGTSYRPKFEVVKWTTRLTELQDARSVDDADLWNNSPTPQSDSATHVPPPAAKASAHDLALETEF